MLRCTNEKVALNPEDKLRARPEIGQVWDMPGAVGRLGECARKIATEYRKSGPDLIITPAATLYMCV
jgi:hypothetical protein